MSVPNMTLVDCMPTTSKSFYLHEISLAYMIEKFPPQEAAAIAAFE